MLIFVQSSLARCPAHQGQGVCVLRMRKGLLSRCLPQDARKVSRRRQSARKVQGMRTESEREKRAKGEFAHEMATNCITYTIGKSSCFSGVNSPNL
jgi:hypothetical protein